jgi:hypothetical protein
MGNILNGDRCPFVQGDRVHCINQNGRGYNTDLTIGSIYTIGPMTANRGPDRAGARSGWVVSIDEDDNVWWHDVRCFELVERGQREPTQEMGFFVSDIIKSLPKRKKK